MPHGKRPLIYIGRPLYDSYSARSPGSGTTRQVVAPVLGLQWMVATEQLTINPYQGVDN